jgi:hypothetical protein
MPYADPDTKRTYHREYKRANRFRYRARQKTYDAAKHANDRAAIYGVPGMITPEEVEAVLAVGQCRYCGVEMPDLTLDHIVPMDKGGPNLPANLGAACRTCNISKFRGVRPGRWAHDHDACIDCGETSRIHSSHGRCDRCHQRFLKRLRRTLRAGLSAPGN